jgi:hypothetical protein
VKGGICLGDTVRMPLWRFRESSLDEVLIERKGRADAQSPHHNEGNTIRERVIFIVMLLEIRPCFIKQRLIDVDQQHGRTA